MRPRSYLQSATLALLLAGAAFASAPQTTKQLAQARDDAASQAAMTKGAAQQTFELERRRPDQLIDDLREGREVSPAQIHPTDGSRPAQ